MKILVFNDSAAEFNVIKEKYSADDLVIHTVRYLQFLYEIERENWDVIYIDDILTENPNRDFWTDGNGVKQEFTGLHAARMLTSLSTIKNSKIYISVHDESISRGMYKILKDSKIDAIKTIV